VNPLSEAPHPILSAIRSWEDQNRLEQEAMSRGDWESLERCQAEKDTIIARMDRLMRGRTWESAFSQESSRKVIRERVRNLIDGTRSSLVRLASMKRSMETEWAENRRTLGRVHQVRDAYNPSDTRPTWIRHS